MGSSTGREKILLGWETEIRQVCLDHREWMNKMFVEIAVSVWISFFLAEKFNKLFNAYHLWDDVIQYERIQNLQSKLEN